MNCREGISRSKIAIIYRGQLFVDADERNSTSYEEFWTNLRNGIFQTGEYRRVAKNGKEIWIQASYSPILDLNGKPFKIVKYASNVTDQVLARKTLEYLRKPGVPVIFLGRRAGHRERAQAYALGASIILPNDSDTITLVNAVKRLSGLNGEREASERDLFSEGVHSGGKALASMFDKARRGQQSFVPEVIAGADAIIGIVQGETLAWLDVVWGYDHITYQHCLLVTGLAAMFAARLGFRRDDQRLLAQAAFVHDVGKSRIPLHILNKPDKLTAEETMIMRTHASVGHEILSRQACFDPRVLEVVRHHHEYLDGSGYPDGLVAEQLPDLVRLTTICDIYAALIERRAYKAPMPPGDAIAILQGMKKKLDPDFVYAFANLVSS